MPLLPTADGHVEYLVTGTGTPVTVFAHGLAGSIPETRPFGSGVAGSRAFLHFRGHGASAAPETAWTYPALAAELAAVADEVGATQALGVSLGAGALLRLAADEPDRFRRLVLVLPATIDRPRADPAVLRMQRLAEHLDHRDVDAVAAELAAEQPAGVRDRPDVRHWARKQAHRLTGSTVARALRELPTQHPLEDRSKLAVVHSPVLVIGHEGDEAHPAQVARELADALPSAELVVFDAGGVLWTHRSEVRRLISGFLGR